MSEKTSTEFKSIYVLWWIFLFIKLLLSATIPLSQDETYYWVWSQHLQLSYFDHPAMVSWLMWLGHVFEPLGQAVRWPGVLMGHLTLMIWIELLRVLNFKRNQIFVWLLLTLSSPLLGVGSMIITPDLPVIFFWSLSLLLVQKALTKQNLKFYAFLGISLGLGFCSKYHIVLFIPSLFLYLTWDSQFKKISIFGALITLVFGVLFSLPVLIWNYQHDFSSFKFQLQHGLGGKTWEPLWTVSYIFGQVILIFPTTFWAALKSYRNRLLGSFSFLPLAFFFVSSFKGVVEVNWPIIAYPSFLAMAAGSSVSKRILSLSSYFWGAISVLVVFVLIFAIPVNLPEKLTEMRYFDPILPVAKEYSPLYLGSYQMASTFWYQYKTPYKKLYQINRHDLFDEMSSRPPEENKYFVIKEPWVPMPDWMTLDKYSYNKIKDLPPKFELIEVIKK